LEHVLETWEWEVGMEIQSHYERLLKTDFAPISVIENDLAEHPNLSMVINYNLFVRETYLGVLEHIRVFLTQCKDFQEMSASKGNKEVGTSGTTDRRSDKNSVLHFQHNLTKQSNRAAKSSTDTTLTKKIPTDSLRPNGESVSTKFVSSEPTNTGSTGNWDQQYNYLTQESQKFNTQSHSYGQKSQKRINATTTTSFSVGNFNPQYYSAKPTPNSPDVNSDTLISSGRVNPSEERRNSTAIPKSPHGNFDSQPYSNASPKIPNGNSNSLDQSSHWTDSTTSPQLSSENQYSQPLSNATSKFPPGTSDSQSYSHHQSSQKVDSITTPGSPSENKFTRPFSAYGTPKSQSYSVDQATQKRFDSTTTPNFSNGDSDSQYYSNGQTTSPQEWINAIAPSDFPKRKKDSQFNSIDLQKSTQNPTEDSVASYTQSLLSDQRGDTSRQQQVKGGNQFPSQNRQGISSTATTYEEYIQQRQAASTDRLDQSPSIAPGSQVDMFLSPTLGTPNTNGTDFQI